MGKDEGKGVGERCGYGKWEEEGIRMYEKRRGGELWVWEVGRRRHMRVG